MKTLDQVRAEVAEGRTKPEGVVCPCCDQFVKTYKRKFGSSYARALIYLARATGFTKDYRHVTEMGFPSEFTFREFDKLQAYGLVRRRQNEDTKKRDSGYWRLTSKGIGFVRGMAVVPAYVFIDNKKVLGFSIETTTIVAALGKKFDYSELMAS